MKKLLSVLLALSMLLGCVAFASEDDWDTEAFLVTVMGQDYGPAAETPELRDAAGTNGAVVSGKGEASEVGIAVLEAGGNAVDAAVATGLAIGYFEPNASGLGGGGFMNIWLSDEQRAVAISSQFPAPMNVTEDYFAELFDEDGNVDKEKRSEFQASGKSVSIMKALATYQVALDNYGTMTLAEIMPYVIEACQQGIRVTQNFKSLYDSSYSKLIKSEGSQEVWFKDGIIPYELDEVIYNEPLIETFEKIAEEGIEYFYTGELGQKIIDAIQADGGVMTMEDMEQAMTDVLVIEDPVEVTYRGYRLYSMPLPSSGGVILGEILNIMENVDVASMEHNSAEYIHVLSEAMKLAYADRAEYLGDPAYVDDELVEALSSKDYALEQYNKISETPNLDPVAGNPYANEGPNTTHISVIDKDGNMVAMTQSINSHFGCGITVDGVVLSNGLMSFDLEPGHPNSIAPGKLSLSSMTPTILLRPDGTPMLVSGSPGGTYIIACMAQTIINLVDFNLPITEAVYSPRVAGTDGGKTRIEGRLDQEVIDELTEMGHDIEITSDYDPNMGSSNSIVVLDDGTYHGCGDPRRDSQCAAY